MQNSQKSAQRTRDRDVIRKWASVRGGKPARVRASRNGGILRIDFREPDEGLQEISWEEFFATFDRSDVDFLYEEKTAGGQMSRFNKFVSRDD